jgi:hypothetical protein
MCQHMEETARIMFASSGPASMAFRSAPMQPKHLARHKFTNDREAGPLTSHALAKRSAICIAENLCPVIHC